MSTIPGLFVIGEANFSDHGANRLGASALMQGLSDGYFIVPYTLGNYLASNKLEKRGRDRIRVPASSRRGRRRSDSEAAERQGHAHGDSFHRELGKIVWDYCGMSRNAAGLEQRHREDSRAARGILARSKSAGRRRGDQSVARKSRPRRRLLRAGRADVHRRAAIATNPAAAISAKSIRRPTAKPCATTSISATSPPGNTRAQISRPSCTKSRSRSSTCILASGATSECG